MRELYSDNLAWLSAVTETVCGESLLQWTDQTVLVHLELLRGVVDDTARVVELARFTEGRFDDAFRAYQLSITAQDGAAVDQIVAVSERVIDHVRESVGLALALIATDTGLDPGGARDAMLAVLAAEKMSVGEPVRDRRQIEPSEEMAANE